jgi:hypothetical protein
MKAHTTYTSQYTIDHATTVRPDGMKVLRASITLAPASSGITGKLVTVTCHSIPSLVSATANILTIETADNAKLVVQTKLNLHSYPIAQRKNFQLNQITSKPLADCDWMKYLSASDLELAQAVWNNYHFSLYDSYLELCGSCVRLPADYQPDVLAILAQFVRPTSFDLGVRCKSAIRTIACRMYGSNLAGKMVQAMNSSTFLEYLALQHHLARTTN